MLPIFKAIMSIIRIIRKGVMKSHLSDYERTVLQARL